MPFFAILLSVLFLSFLLGSIPSGVLISRVFYDKDVRDYGSGNIGTTNSFRVMGKVGGSVVFVIDFLKGLLSALFAWGMCQWLIGLDPLSAGACQVVMATSFFGVVAGHIYTPWLHFNGGKGIATAVGSLFIVFGPLLAVLELAIFALFVAATKKISVGSLAAAFSCPFISIYVFWGNKLAWLLMTITAILVIYAHRSNIQRLRDHTEATIDSKKAVSRKDSKDDEGSAESVIENEEDLSTLGE